MFTVRPPEAAEPWVHSATFAEAGYPQVQGSNWMGYIAPKGTPPAIVAKLHAAFVKAIGHADVKERILSQSNELGGGWSATARY